MEKIALVLAAALALCAPAAAQTPPTGCPHRSVQSAPPPPAVIAARKAERQACAADMAKFCANVAPGCGRPMQCMRAHASQLSAACTGAQAQLRAARAQIHAVSPAGQH
ncbi:MAG TPA: hypothetical protein VF835_02755 [Rhizomicrobium sp.]